PPGQSVHSSSCCGLPPRASPPFLPISAMCSRSWLTASPPFWPISLMCSRSWLTASPPALATRSRVVSSALARPRLLVSSGILGHSSAPSREPTSTRGAQERFKDLAPSSFGLISMAARRPSPRGGRQARTWRGPVSPEKTREGVEPPGPPSWPNPFYPGEGSRGLRPPHGQHRDARQAV